MLSYLAFVCFSFLSDYAKTLGNTEEISSVDLPHYFQCSVEGSFPH